MSTTSPQMALNLDDSMICSGCQLDLSVGAEYLQCMVETCGKLYHHGCNNRTLTEAEKAVWVCPECACAAKKGGRNCESPVGTPLNTKNMKNVAIRKPPTDSSRLEPARQRLSEDDQHMAMPTRLEILLLHEKITYLTEELASAVATIGEYRSALSTCMSRIEEISIKLEASERPRESCPASCSTGPTTHANNGDTNTATVNPKKGCASKRNRGKNNTKNSDPITAIDTLPSTSAEAILVIPPAIPSSNNKVNPSTGIQENAADDSLSSGDDEDTTSGVWNVQMSKKKKKRLSKERGIASLNDAEREKCLSKTNRNSSVRCTAGPDVTSLKAVEQRKHLHLWNMLSGADDIRAYLKTLCPEGNCTVDDLKPKDCLHLQLYRDPKDRFKKGQTKASLSLQQFLGFESGFTLDKESNTIAIICQDVIVVLAFETRERLISWQVKVGGQLGSSKEWLVMIGGGSRKLPAGPARLHLQGKRFTLTSGVPPRLLGLWVLAHLRRYGVVEGRFCFEGGSHCGKGEGLHVLITDQAQDITDGFDAATHGTPRAPASRKSGGAEMNRPDTRLSDLNTDQSMPDVGLYEENFFGEDCGGVSPFWPSDERREFDDHDCKGCEEHSARPPWSGADHVTLERCNNCVTKLGTITRSSTVALTPGNHFNLAWTMEAGPESNSDNSSNSTEYLTPRAIKKSLEASQIKEWAPQRPPKPARLEEMKAPAPLPVAICVCSSDRNAAHASNANNPKVGPYENYDVPKSTHVEVESANEYYDTPKRIKKALADDLFQVTKNSAPGNLVLKKNCGCILKFGSKKKPVIVECDENIQPVECPCQKVTNWANNLISLPYCKRNINYDKVNTEVLSSQKSEEMALYATVDVSRKTNRQSSIAEKDSLHNCNEPFMNYENLRPKGDMEFEDPYANYENLEFALSLEYYENAKDLLKKAGVTQKELDALSANVDFADITFPPKPKHCAKCGHSAKYQAMKKNKSDEYLLMEPPKDVKRDLCRTTGPNPGYTPMSPNPNWSQSLRHPLQKLHRVDIEKSLSIPTLNGSANRTQSFEISTSTNNNKEAIQKRSSSVDSARLLEDLKEFDSSIGSHATSSSLETLRNLAIENRRTSFPCDNERDCCDHDCCKSSDSENKTSEGSCSKDMPHLRNKHMDNAQIKRSSSVPCKSGGNRDSSSSNDSGVSSCSMKHGPEFNEFEMPLTSGNSRYQYMAQRRMRGNATGCIHSSLPRKSKSSDPLRDMTMQIHKASVSAKSSSAEAEVPVLPPKQLKGVMDTHSTSSGTSDMSDYIETLSLTSSHSSSDNPNLRLARQPTTTLRPRSGKEYHNLDPIITSMYKSGKELSNYTNLP